MRGRKEERIKKKGANMREAVTIEHLTSTDSLALDCVVRTKDTARCIPFIVQQFLKIAFPDPSSRVILIPN